MQTPGGVEHHHVEALQLRRLQRALGNIDRLLPGDDRQRRHIALRAQHRELLLRGRTLHVERRHQYLLTLTLLEALSEFGRRRGLARPLQADHHDDGGRGHVDHQVRRFGPQRFRQRVGNDLDDHLPRRNRPQHVAANGPFGRLIDELAHNREGDIGFEQRDSHLAHRGADIVLRERTTPPQFIEYPTQTIAQRIEHHHLNWTKRPGKQRLPCQNDKIAGGRNLANQRPYKTPGASCCQDARSMDLSGTERQTARLLACA